MDPQFIPAVQNPIPEPPTNPDPQGEDWLVPPIVFIEEIQDFVRLIGQSEWYYDKVIVNNIKTRYLNKRYWDHLCLIVRAYDEFIN